MRTISNKSWQIGEPFVYDNTCCTTFEDICYFLCKFLLLSCLLSCISYFAGNLAFPRKYAQYRINVIFIIFSLFILILLIFLIIVFIVSQRHIANLFVLKDGICDFSVGEFCDLGVPEQNCFEGMIVFFVDFTD